MPTGTPRLVVALILATVIFAQSPLPYLTPIAEAYSPSSFFQSLSSLFGVEKAKTAWSKVFGSVPTSTQVGQVVGGGTFTCGGTEYTSGYCCNDVWFDPHYADLSNGCPAGTFYHVNVQAGNASDSNPGTMSAPWATIQRATEVLSAGDVAIIHPGTYYSQTTGSRYTPGLNASRSGTAGNPIVFKAVGEVTVLPVVSLTGSVQAATAGTVTLGSEASSVDDYYDGWFIRITSGTGAGQYRRILANLSNLSEISYVGSTKMAHVLTDWDVIPDGTSRYTLTKPGPILGALNRSHIVWDGVRVEERDNYAFDTGPVVIWGSESVTIMNSEIDAQPQVLYDNHNAIRVEASRDFTIRNNDIHGTVYTVALGNNGQNHAAIMIYTSDNGIIEHNDIHDSYTCIFPKGGNGGHQIRYNNIYNCTKGLRISYHTNVNIYQNIFRNMSSVALQPAENNSNVVFANNVIYDSASGVNNWFASNGYTHYNNIQSGAVYPFNFEGALGDVVSNNNLYHDFTDFRIGNRNVGGFSAWQTLGHDQAGVATNPLFVNATAGDFRLQAGSPARTLGRDVLDLDHDGSTADNIPAGAYITSNEVIGIIPSGTTATEATNPPTVSLTASHASVTVGQSSTLSWTSTNSTSCTASGGWTGTKATSGTQTVTPTTNTTYTLACTGTGGTATDSAPVTVTPAASTKFTQNQRIQVTDGPVNVRSTANGTLLGTQATGNLGTVTGGPTYAGGDWWWNINFDSGVDGWVAEDFLGSYTAPNTCTSFTYSAWSSCQPGDTQTRTVLTSSPSGCTGGTPITTQSCTYTAPDTTPPSLANVAATSLSTTGATVSWSTNEPSDTQVEYGTTLSYGQTTTRVSTLTTSHSVTLSGLSAGTTYHYRVHSRDAAGNLATSEDYTVTTALGSDTTTPSTPANVSGTVLSPTSASLTWSASTDPAASGQTTSGMKQYRIYRCTGSTCTATTEVGTTTSLGYEDTVLTQGTTYRYRVRAEDNAGNLSAYSSSASVTTPATPPPSDTTPPTISNVSTSAITTDSVTITWDTNEPSDSTVRYGKTTLTETATDATLVTSHSVTLSGLTRKTTYTYTVSSTDNAGNTATSPSYTVKTASGKPPKLTNVSATQGSVILAWDSYADTLAESIEVYRATGNYTTPSGTPLATLDTTTTTYTDTDTTPGTRYFYTLVVADNDGTQSDPSYVSFTPQTTTTGGSSSGGSGSSSSGGGGGTSGGGGGSSGTTDTPKTTPKNDTPKQTTGGTTWRHTRTPATPSTQVVPASVAARYGMPYFTYRGIEADLLKVYDAGTMLILTVGSGSKLQKVSPTAQVYKDGECHTIQLSRVLPLTTDGMLLGKGYYFLRPADPLYTPTGAFTARMQMNLPGCDNATCNVNGELLQEWGSEEL